MKVLIIGSGGREHALAWKIAKSPMVREVICAPGNAGTNLLKKCRNILINADECVKLLRFAIDEKIDLVVFGPEDPLAAGYADIFERNGITVFGPSILGSMMEASKEYAKKIMQKYGIPTAPFRSFTDSEAAKEYILEKGLLVVVKADGLTGGKGAIVFQSIGEAFQAIDKMMIEGIYGKAGKTVLIEDRLKGKEASYLFFTDGKIGKKHIKSLVLCEDHKSLLDGDKGPNTGGMGIGSPPLDITLQEERKMAKIAEKLVYATKKEGIDYRGLCYIGFIICNGWPYVLEVNCRFGDPETQPILMRMKSDIVPILMACADGTLDKHEIVWDERPAVSVVLASKGYPEKPEDGKVVSGLKQASKMKDVVVFYAGAVKAGKEIKTRGGRNFSVNALGEDIRSASQRVYEAVGKISYEGMYYRRDIPRSLYRKVT